MANYHVNYLTGSDITGDGSTSTPWQTISHALTTSSATTGDVIKVVGSTTTDLDTGATVSTNDRTNQLTTSTDLTSSLAVGDIIIISPNITDGTEFNGWMHTEVEAITATTLTTRGYHVYPNQTTLSMTITKVNDPVLGNTQETINTPDVYAGAIIECGYDATFTSVIGHTYWVNNAVGVGSRSGTKFSISSVGSIGEWDNGMPLFRNIAFARFEYGIQMQFGRIAYANNIILLNASAKAGGQQFYMGPGTDTNTLIYLNDCDGAVLDKNYYEYGLFGDNAVGNGAPLHVFANQNRDRQIEDNGGTIENVTGYFIKGRVFGMATLFNRSVNLYITGDLVMMGLDDQNYTADFYRAPAAMTGSGQLVLSSLKIVRNGLTAEQTPFNFIATNDEGLIATNSYVKLPAGASVKDYYLIATGNSPQMNSNNIVTFEDVDGLWSSQGCGVFYKQNTTGQETGTSCLEVYKAPGESYSGTAFGGYVASFPTNNGGLRLSGITFRYKKISGNATGFRVVSNVSGRYGNDVGAVNFTNTAYADSTVTLGTSTMSKYINSLPSNVQLPFALQANSDNNDTCEVLIDSITPIYS